MAPRNAGRDQDDDAPWLAEAGGGRERTRVSKRSVFWTLLILLSLTTVIAVGLILLLAKKDGGSTEGFMNPEQAPLITAEPGPYKVPPADPKGLAVEGQDQTIYAAGEGIDQGSVIDQSALPEAPLPRPGTAPDPAAPGPPRDILPDAAVPEVAVPPVATPKPAPPVKPAPAKPESKPAGKAGTVQLGAFSSPEKAEEAWARLAGKHGLTGKRIIAVDANGKTLYRLRASGDAAQICQKMKAAGDTCAVVE